MVTATELKVGTTFLLDNKPHKVIKYNHQKIGRGGANVKLSLRNLESGALVEKTFGSANKFEEVSTLKRPLQYLYADDQTAVFMNPESYDQVELPLEVIGDDLSYLQEGANVDVLFWGQKPLSLELPPKLTFTVTSTPPGIKGNSATNLFKSATLENNLTVKVPLFIKSGDKIRVDTRTGEYIERVN